MTMKNKLSAIVPLVGRITRDGEVIAYSEYIAEGSIHGLVYSKDSKANEILDICSASTTWWGDVEDYVTPILGELLVDALEWSPEVYKELMSAISSAYGKLKDIAEIQKAEGIL
jgi:hypothetical protein